MPIEADKPQIVLFSDDPICDKANDRFHHEIFVDALLKTTQAAAKQARAVNIGLFGKWGAGKSSIVQMYAEDIRKDASLAAGLKVVVFNVWKHSFDSLRRQFLIFLDSPEGLNTALKVREKLDVSTNRTRSKHVISWRNLLICTAILVGVYCLVRYVADEKFLTSALFAVVMALLYEVFRGFLHGLVTEEQTTRTTHRLDQADQFEAQFREMLRAFRKPERKRVVVVFDDLDRCSEEKVFETLTLIKTFLDEEGCIYIIPCDDERVKNHLREKMGYTAENADEFLRKFFQAYIRIPPFGDEDIFGFARELAKIAGLPREIEKVIASAFAETPRHVKQFLNNLSILLHIASEREKAGAIRKGLVTGNPALLAKVEAIRVRWPATFDELVADESLLSLLEGVITGRTDQVSNEKVDKARVLLEKGDGLKKFLFATIDVKKEGELVAFTRLSQPQFSSALGDSGDFISRALTGDIEFAKAKLGDPEKGAKYLDALIDVAKKRIEAGYPDQAFNALNVLVETYSELPVGSRPAAAFDIVAMLSRTELKAKAWVMSMRKLFIVLLDANDDLANALIKELAHSVGDFSKAPPSLNTQREVIEQLLANWGKLKAKRSDTIKAISIKINQVLSEDPDKGKVLVDAVAKCQDLEAKKALAAADLPATICAKISNGTTPADQELKTLLAGLSPIFSEENKTPVLAKAAELIRANLNATLDVQKRLALDMINLVEPPISLAAKEADFCVVMSNFIVNIPNWPDKLLIASAMFRLSSNLAENNFESFCSHLVNFINPLDANFSRQLLTLAEEAKVALPDQVWNALRGRALAFQDQDLLERAMRRLSASRDQLKAYFDELLTRNIQIAVAVFQKVHPQLPQADGDVLIERLLARTKQFAPPQMPVLFSPVVDGLVKASQETRDSVGDRILELLRDFEANPLTQPVALQYLGKVTEKLSKTKKEYLVAQLINKARGIAIVPNGHQPTATNILRGILFLQDHLSEDGRESYIDCLLPRVVTAAHLEAERVQALSVLTDMRAIPESRYDQVFRGLYEAFRATGAATLRESIRVALGKFKDQYSAWDGWKDFTDLEVKKP
jgi:hypothetical protein